MRLNAFLQCLHTVGSKADSRFCVSDYCSCQLRSLPMWFATSVYVYGNDQVYWTLWEHSCGLILTPTDWALNAHLIIPDQLQTLKHTHEDKNTHTTRHPSGGHNRPEYAGRKVGTWMNMSIQTTGMSGIPTMPSQIQVPSRADEERREANRKWERWRVSSQERKRWKGGDERNGGEIKARGRESVVYTVLSQIGHKLGPETLNDFFLNKWSVRGGA